MPIGEYQRQAASVWRTWSYCHEIAGQWASSFAAC